MHTDGQMCIQTHTKSARAIWISNMENGYFLAFVFF